MSRLSDLQQPVLSAGLAHRLRLPVLWDVCRCIWCGLYRGWRISRRSLGRREFVWPGHDNLRDRRRARLKRTRLPVRWHKRRGSHPGARHLGNAPVRFCWARRDVEVPQKASLSSRFRGLSELAGCAEPSSGTEEGVLRFSRSPLAPVLWCRSGSRIAGAAFRFCLSTRSAPAHLAGAFLSGPSRLSVAVCGQPSANLAVRTPASE